jgi:hypothetical protein
MRRFGALTVHGVGRLRGGGHGFGEGLGVRFGGSGLLWLGNNLGRDHGLGADGRDRRGRLVGMIVVGMIVLVIVIMGVLVIMGMMIVVTMIVMIMGALIVVVVIVAFVLAVMLGIGMQMLAFVQGTLGMLRLRRALDRLGGGISAGIEAFDNVAAHALAMTTAAGIAVARAAASMGAVLALLFGLAMGLFLGLDQRLPVGDRDLVIVGMDFAEGEEAVAVAAIFDEGGLERGFDPCDLGEVDIPAQLLALRGLEIKLFDAIAADHDDPGLFRVGGIDQHLVGHVLTLGGGGHDSPWARIAPPGDATVHLIRG